MNQRIRLIGTVAAVALSLSMVTGVMAQDDSQAVLTNNPDGLCTASITSSTLNLGTWEWNGTAYVVDGEYGTANIATGNIQVIQDISSEPVNCNVTAVAGALDNGDGDTIAAGSLTAVLNPLAQPIETDAGATGNPVALKVTLSGVGTPPAGTYTGTITVTANLAA